MTKDKPDIIKKEYIAPKYKIGDVVVLSTQAGPMQALIAAAHYIEKQWRYTFDNTNQSYVVSVTEEKILFKL